MLKEELYTVKKVSKMEAWKTQRYLHEQLQVGPRTPGKEVSKATGCALLLEDQQ